VTNRLGLNIRQGTFAETYLEETMTTILIVVVLFLLLGGGGYYGFRRRG
jgi:LPXTG-motif cell wall-anchored protein